jgi:hypothetical protein
LSVSPKKLVVLGVPKHYSVPAIGGMPAIDDGTLRSINPRPRIDECSSEDLECTDITGVSTDGLLP